MSEVRLNFLNWRPDQEAFGHDGLVVADNVIHDTEGYKQVTRNTDTARSTIIGAPTSSALQVRPMGSVRDALQANKMACRIGGLPATQMSVTFHIGIGQTAANVTGVSATFAHTGGTATPCASQQAITSFQVCELNDYLFVTAHGEGLAAGGTAVSANLTAYLLSD